MGAALSDAEILTDCSSKEDRQPISYERCLNPPIVINDSPEQQRTDAQHTSPEAQPPKVKEVFVPRRTIAQSGCRVVAVSHRRSVSWPSAGVITRQTQAHLSFAKRSLLANKKKKSRIFDRPKCRHWRDRGSLKDLPPHAAGARATHHNDVAADAQLLECESLLCSLLTNDADRARSLQYSTQGCAIDFPALRTHRQYVVHLSETIAMALSGGMSPCSCIALQSGRLAPLSPAQMYQLRLINGKWLLAADNACFNFVLRRWQPMNVVSHGPYADVKDVLYVAFVPQKLRGTNALFVKIGYRELAGGEVADHNSLIGYLEKKSTRIQLTNIPGAGMFVFDVPDNHKVFDRPGRAAEASLKTEMLHCRELQVTPTGDSGEVGTFSASLEYYFVSTSSPDMGALEALTLLLQQFTGNSRLKPRRAVATAEGGPRRGRKRLRSWTEEIPSLAEGERASFLTQSFCGQSRKSGMMARSNRLPETMQALQSRALRAKMEGKCTHKADIKSRRCVRKTC